MKFIAKDIAAFIDPDGYQYWCKNGRLHRENGPAVIWCDGTKEWCKNGTKI